MESSAFRWWDCASFSVLAQALVIVVTGLMARELGGGRLAQVTAALAVALSPVPLFEGTEFQYTTFDYLWWVLVAYFVVRLLKTENPRWWLAIGATIGVGLMTKYTMSLLCGRDSLRRSADARSPLSPERVVFGAVGLALLIFLPNLVWQVHHGFISYQFLQHIHVRDVKEGRANGFVRNQFLICTNFYAAPFWIAGLWCFLRSRRYRLLAWMYLVPLTLFYFAKGRFYYLAAGVSHADCDGCGRRRALGRGAATAEAAGGGRRAIHRNRWRRAVQCALILPLASGGPLMHFALEKNDALREEIRVERTGQDGRRHSRFAASGQQASVGVLVGNYGEQGAIEILGPAYHLPSPISMTNSAWLRGYPVPPPSTLIVIGFSRETAERAFTSCRLAGQNGNPYGIQNEESQYHPDIFVCDGPRIPWPEFWKEYQSFG